MTTELCALESRGVLGEEDLDYVPSPSLSQWTIYQMLLDAGLSEADLIWNSPTDPPRSMGCPASRLYMLEPR